MLVDTGHWTLDTHTTVPEKILVPVLRREGQLIPRVISHYKELIKQSHINIGGEQSHKESTGPKSDCSSCLHSSCPLKPSQTVLEKLRYTTATYCHNVYLPLPHHTLTSHHSTTPPYTHLQLPKPVVGELVHEAVEKCGGALRVHSELTAVGKLAKDNKK
ncbi:hypothetical protein E2C01_005279 [Portunus trituberculatus]|uniref:Uncharacterized protein n=1 Tax=Portunus trituberculatus TaxID=210409 RepID=A0A5B7CSX5_PORTR|nr:hypothetical protein [Portunus trituberculatus]